MFGCIIVGSTWLNFVRELTDLAESGLESAGRAYADGLSRHDASLRALGWPMQAQQQQPELLPVPIDEDDEHPPLTPPMM